MDRKFDLTTFISNYLYFKKAENLLKLGNFARLIKILTMFIKTTFKDSKKLIELCIKMQSISVFLDIKNLLIFDEKC